MGKIFIPDDYATLLSIRETEVAIKKVKDYFEKNLARRLNLTRVSAPLFVETNSGMNDTLNGVERPVSFDILDGGVDAEIVHSLAKWKRFALKRYGFTHGEGLYTDMNAVRRDEELDNIHSLFVDQWDWEKVIDKTERNIEFLKETVKTIYATLKDTEDYIANEYNFIQKTLSDEIYFITSQELEDLYPNLTSKERENKIVKEKGSVFLMQIGGLLRSGKIHDGRAPDYDDWSLNGDILVYNPMLDSSLELSSMGIRVDKESLMHQLTVRGCLERTELPFHKALLNDELPFTIGGGIGQSRMCMLFLRKAHIGEVQSSIWPAEMVKECEEKGIHLL
ncbi:MAG: aspartate--ammonia ligase [Clostridia bacterium]|nr:aspartate--ammonia ligase [Clostridia bacterium]